VAGGHDLVARWCALAEQRLEYLTEMFESGRWRRYHSERAFLENIREAKVAVETWRGLSTPASVEGLSAVTLSPSVPMQEPKRRAIEPAVAPPATGPDDVVPTAEAEPALPEDVASALAIDMQALERALEVPAPSFDLSLIEQRYPLLRNTL
jgi:hypothetical protein